jgi:4-hydroxy-4-methyl-2-oxoglutarate aldolase
MAERDLMGASAAAVHEAYGRNGALPSAIKPIGSGFRICGPAFTVDCPAGDNLWLHRAIYAAQSGDVLIADTRGHTEAGYWGEILSHAALARGLAGLVIAGGVRDTEAVAALSFPVFAANICIRGTEKDPRGNGRLGQPILIGDVTIRTGDLIVGDADGVVVVEAARAPAVTAAVRNLIAAEQDVFKRLSRGETTLQILGLPA